jgi:N-acetylmuramoyl-L-alanine amidase
MARRNNTTLIVLHCSATKPSQDIGADTIAEWHISRGFGGIGYHFVIRRNGALEAGRPLEDIGAHVAGHNSNSVGVCMVGGLDDQGRSFSNSPDQYTGEQWVTVNAVIDFLRALYPAAKVCGHRDLSPDLNRDGRIEPSEWLKTCPGFDAGKLFPV